MTVPPVLVSVNVGMPKDVPWNGKMVHTGICKSPVAGPVMVRRLNIDGDGQGDLGGHGGEREVCHRIAAGFVQQHDVLAVGDPAAAEPDSHAAAQRLGEQHPVGERAGDEEPADGSGCQRPLLPGQAHGYNLL